MKLIKDDITDVYQVRERSYPIGHQVGDQVWYRAWDQIPVAVADQVRGQSRIRVWNQLR
jgi:hypothetical protein